MMNRMNTSITYGNDGTVYLTNIEGEKVVDLMAIPCPVWGDRKAYGEIIKSAAIARDLY